MTAAPREMFLNFARLRQHQGRVVRARGIVAEWLAQTEKPYIAFSAGKDSTVTLALIREQRPETPAVYFDADCAFPEVDRLLDATPNLIRFPADEPFLQTLSRYTLSDPRLERATMQSTVWGPVRRLLARHGFDGMAYGLRAEESRGRAMHFRQRGAIFRYRRDGVLACQPICQWSYHDVWAFIFSQNLEYAKTYDRMWDMQIEDQRISYWAGETKRNWGRYVWLKRNYPELWNRLAAALPEVRAYA